MKEMIRPPGHQTTAPAPAPSAPPGGGKKSFDLVDIKQYFHIVVKRIWLVALCFVVSLVVMVVMLSRQVPVYESSCKLLLSRGLPLPYPLRQEEIELRGDYILTQQNIIQSKLVVTRAQDRLNRSIDEIGEKIQDLSVNQLWKTAILTLSVTSIDPIFAAEFANALADEYLDFKVEERMDTSQSQVISLTQQANRLLEELKKADEKTLAFVRDNSVIAIQELGNIAAQNLASLAEMAAALRTQRMMLEAQQPLLSQSSDETVLMSLQSPLSTRLGFAQPSIASLQIPAAPRDEKTTLERPEALIEQGVIEQPTWLEIQRQKARYEAEIVELRTRFRDEHPAIRTTLKAIEQADRDLAIELQFALRQFQTQLSSLSIREQAAKRVELEWQDEAMEISRKQHEYNSLARNASRLENLYDLIFNRLKEIDISVGIEPETIRIIERAEPAGSPTSPHKVQSIFMAAMIGLGIGLALVFGLEYIDDSIRYPEEVTHGLGVNFLGVIPAANWDPDDLRTHLLSNFDQKSGLAEAYRNMRSSILFGSAQADLHCLVVTSAVPLEGKTTTCLNLAVSLAQTGARVLLVDGDLRRGELHKFFGLEGGRGLSDILVGQAKPDSVIQRTALPNLDLVATGPFPPNPAELMFRPELRSFLDYARRSYDRVLFDCAPIMAVSEAPILASIAEGVVFVIWAGHTSRKICQSALQILRERGAQVLGCVLNNLEFGRVGYYYYSTYYGYYDYDYRYEKSRPAGRPK